MSKTVPQFVAVLNAVYARLRLAQQRETENSQRISLAHEARERHRLKAEILDDLREVLTDAAMDCEIFGIGGD